MNQKQIDSSVSEVRTLRERRNVKSKKEANGDVLKINLKAYIYFIHEDPRYDVIGDCYPNLYKIGFSTNPIQRLKNLQTGNARIMSILYMIECPNKKNAKQLEGAIHIKFISKCRGGEWFQINDMDIANVDRVVAHLNGNDLPPDLFEDMWRLLCADNDT